MATQRNTKSRAPLPAILRDDTRPDPTVLSDSERFREFGRLMFRVIERRTARNNTPKTIKDAN